jgi:predicted nucleotide-binding protein (sugar kinase/HSP70/actin superfamily)
MPEEAMAKVFGIASDLPLSSAIEPDLNIAVVGYPYAIYDPYLNVGLLKILKQQGVRIYTQDMLRDRDMNRFGKTLPKQTFWYFSNRAVDGALYYMKKPAIDGIIHVTAFACGPDSIIDRLMEIETHRRSKLPYLSVTIDEQTGESGVRTRIEAFLDMLRFRRDAR